MNVTIVRTIVLFFMCGIGLASDSLSYSKLPLIDTNNISQKKITTTDSLNYIQKKSSIPNTHTPSLSKNSDNSTRTPVENPQFSNKILKPMFQKKRNTAIIGATLTLTGTVIKYGLILPQNKKIDTDDMGERLALLSPQILSLGLQLAGIPISCMRASESCDVYEKYTSEIAPNNMSWFLFFTGLGFNFSASSLSALSLYKDNEIFTDWSQIMGICSDALWVCAHGYALYMIYFLDKRVKKSPLTFEPLIHNFNSYGLTVRIRF